MVSMKKYSQGFGNFGPLEQNQENGYLYKCEEVDEYIEKLNQLVSVHSKSADTANKQLRELSDEFDGQYHVLLCKCFVATLAAVTGWVVIAITLIKYGVTGHVL